MTVTTRCVQLQSRGENDVTDLTQNVQDSVSETRLSSGVVTVFASGSTCAVTTMEYEPGLVRDFPGMLRRIAPENSPYEHHKTWHDNNGHSHVKASLVGASITIPFVEGKLVLGTWQQIVFVELDIRPRKREITLQIMGE